MPFDRNTLVEHRISITTCGRCGCQAEVYKVYKVKAKMIGEGKVEPGFRSDIIPCEENCNCDHSM